jgi:hypothetical protein
VLIGQGSGAGSGAVAASNVKVISSTKITAVTGKGAKAGTWRLLVITPGGTSAGNAGDDFSYDYWSLPLDSGGVGTGVH